MGYLYLLYKYLFTEKSVVTRKHNSASINTNEAKTTAESIAVGNISKIIIFLDTKTKCMEHEVEGSRPRGRPKKTWKDVVREDCQACKLNKEDAMDRCKWRKVIKEAR